MTQTKKYKIGVYGSLREGLHNHEFFLKDKSKYLGEFRTEPNYTMIDLDAFPGILEKGNTPIHMEVYEIDLPTLRAVDSLEGWNEESPESSMYIKKEIQSPYGKISIYVYNTDSFNKKNIVSSGNWKNYYKNKNLINA